MRLCVCLALALTAWPVAVSAAPPAADLADRARLLLLTEDGEAAFEIERAVRIELNDVDVELEVVSLVHAYDLRDRIGVAEREVAERGALGAVWVERGDEGLIVYLVVAGSGMVRRPISGDDPDALTEAAAVVVRHFTTELLEGRPVGLSTVEDERPKPEPKPPVVEPEPERPPKRIDEGQPWRLSERGRLRIQVGYLGHAWSPQVPWQSGGDLSVAWRLKIGVHLGAGYTVFPAFRDTVQHPTDSGVADVEVRRFPATVIVGYQHVWEGPRVAIDAQLRLSPEVVERRALDPVGDRPIAIDPRLVVVPAIEPRVQFDWFFRPPVSLNIALGLRVNTIDYSYGLTIEDPMGNVIERRDYLTPNVVSPTLQIGLGVHL